MWGVAAGAIQMQSAAREAVKLEQYCEIDKWSAPLLGEEAEGGCDRGTLWAQFKVLLGLFTVVTGLFLNWTFLIFKARLDEEKFTEVRLADVEAELVSHTPGQTRLLNC